LLLPWGLLFERETPQATRQNPVGFVEESVFVTAGEACLVRVHEKLLPRDLFLWIRYRL
jgi:hypothetical protein